MKRFLVICAIVLLLILNVSAFSYIFFLNKNPTPKLSETITLYSLNGENANWKLNNGLIIKNNKDLVFYSEFLQYLGRDLRSVNKLSLSMILVNTKDGSQTPLFSVIHDATNATPFDLVKNNKVYMGSSFQNYIAADLSSGDYSLTINIIHTNSDNITSNETFPVTINNE